MYNEVSPVDTLNRMIKVFNNSLNNMMDTYPDHVVEMRFAFNPSTGRRELRLERVTQTLFRATDADAEASRRLTEACAGVTQHEIQPQVAAENC